MITQHPAQNARAFIPRTGVQFVLLATCALVTPVHKLSLACMHEDDRGFGSPGGQDHVLPVQGSHEVVPRCGCLLALLKLRTGLRVHVSLQHKQGQGMEPPIKPYQPSCEVVPTTNCSEQLLKVTRDQHHNLVGSKCWKVTRDQQLKLSPFLPCVGVV